jgi:hypothetical protein
MEVVVTCKRLTIFNFLINFFPGARVTMVLGKLEAKENTFAQCHSEVLSFISQCVHLHKGKKLEDPNGTDGKADFMAGMNALLEGNVIKSSSRNIIL